MKAKEQRKALEKHLKKWFGEVQLEKSFHWLKVPDWKGMGTELSLIANKLVQHRGFDKFFNPGYDLKCDFHIPSINLIIEYDERQHFSAPREVSLSHYPDTISFNFDTKRWKAICSRISAKDNRPPERDETRAFYDSIRDVLSARNGLRLLRVKHGDLDWTKVEFSRQEFMGFIRDKESVGENLKVGMVSFPIWGSNPSKTKAYFKNKKLRLVLKLINENADLDILVFPGHTIFDLKELSKLREKVKNETSLIFFEVWCYTNVQHKAYGIQNGEVIDRGMFQFFGESHQINGREDIMAVFLAHLDKKRVFQLNKNQLKVRLLICGEQNILENKQGNEEVNKPFFRFLSNSQLKNEFNRIHKDTELYINPTHTIMGNQGKIKKRREFFSNRGRVYCSTANYEMGKKRYIPSNAFDRNSLQYCWNNKYPVIGVTRTLDDKHILKVYEMRLKG